jgi:hypothetical protein
MRLRKLVLKLTVVFRNRVNQMHAMNLLLASTPNPLSVAEAVVAFFLLPEAAAESSFGQVTVHDWPTAVVLLLRRNSRLSDPSVPSSRPSLSKRQTPSPEMHANYRKGSSSPQTTGEKLRLSNSITA